MKKLFKDYWSNLILMILVLWLLFVNIYVIVNTHRLVEETKAFNELMEKAGKETLIVGPPAFANPEK